MPAGAVNTDIVALNDLLATTADLLGQKLPPNTGNDSRSILPLLLGKKVDEPIRNEVIVQASGRQYALREGRWKYIQPAGKQKAGELYDLEADPGEKKNLIGEKKDLAEAMRLKLEKAVKGR